MRPEELAALPVSSLAAKNCVLMMWTTDTHLEQALALIKAWGFIYKTVGFYWVKLNKSGEGYFLGLGHWTRSNPEMCLLATRGKPKRNSASVRKLLVSSLQEHSRKPDEARRRIEMLVGGPYCELFAREAAPGWSVAYSNQAGLFDNGPVRTRRRPYRGLKYEES
jgi:N6-adenosine-specific RNA methylase IME4